MDRKEKALTEKQERFCREYLVDFNGSRAAEAAGYSKKTARQQASRLLTVANVAKRLRELIRKRNDRLERKPDDLIEFLWKLLQLDPRDIYESDGTPRPITELPEHVRLFIKGFTVEDLWAGEAGDREIVGQTKKYLLYDKLEAVRLLGRQYGLFTEKLKLEGLEGLAERMRLARERARTGPAALPALLPPRSRAEEGGYDPLKDKTPPAAPAAEGPAA